MTFRLKDNIEKIAPLTDIQAGMLALALRGDADPYYAQKVLEFAGPLDVDALGRAWRTVVAKHAMLRTDFRWNGLKSPLQVVYRTSDATLALDDWRALSSVEQRAKLAEEWQAARTRGFNFEHAASLELQLLRVGDARYWFVWRLHHIQIDGWSMAAVLAACVAAYDRHRTGSASVADEAAEPPFHRYVEWLQKRTFDDTALPPLLAHDGWPTPLPASRARGAHAAPDTAARAPFAEQTVVLDATRTATLERFARERRVTLNTLVQAAWAWLLSRHARTREVCFGVTVSGRPAEAPDVARMVGMFVNTLPLALRVPPQASVGAWLDEVQQANHALRPLEHVPLAKLRARAGLDADAALFDSIVVFENFPQHLSSAAREDGLRISRLDQDAEGEAVPDADAEKDIDAQTYGAAYSSGRNHYPLSLIAVPGETLRLVLSYRCAQLAHRDVRGLIGTLAAVLDAFAADPEQRVGELSLGVPAAQAQSSGQDNPATVLSRVAARAAHDSSRRDAIACVEEDAAGNAQTLSWAELWARAGWLAQRLRGLGVQAETPVALALPRSAAFVASVLGVWRAGGVYVPLDLGAPDARLIWQLKNSGARCVICSADDAARIAALAAEAACETIVADHAFASVEAVATETDAHTAPNEPAHPQQAAYLIYTSGSTGEPKGVTVSHGALANYTHAVLRRLPEGIESAAYTSTPAADLGHTMLFGALAAGWRLHLFSDADVRDPDRFAAAMTRHAVDALKIVPGHLAGLLHAADAAHALPRRALVLGGEAAGPALLTRIATLAPDCAVLNHYGPTETTVGVLTQRLDRAEFARGGAAATLPLGFPLEGASVYLLDADGNPALPGASGEICVGGATLARGYRGRAAATAERFVPDSHGAPGARLYRTGDRAYRRADGALVFEGRLDQQVKIRGYRVEPAEIAATLRALPGVVDAVVIAHADEHGALQLSAFAAGVSLDADALRAELAANLPAHMVPARVSALATLPVTANGKVDRAALLALGTAPQAGDGDGDGSSLAANEAQGPVEPRNEAEATLLAVWRRVLRRDDIGVTDHFFEIGGDSILSLQVIAQARRAGLRFTPKQMFDHPVIERLAALAVKAAATATATAASGGATQAAAQHSRTSQTRFETTPIQRAFFERFGGAQHHWNQAVLLTVPDTLDETALRASLDAVIRTHDALRLRFALHDGVWQQQVGEVSACQFEVFDWRDRADWLVALEQQGTSLQKSLDIEAGPLIRAAWFRLAQGGRLLIAIHHLAVDGVSWRVLLDDLQRAYAQASASTPIELTASAPWSVWAQRLAQYARRSELRNELSWWRGALSAARADVRGFVAAKEAAAPTVASVQTLESSFETAFTRTLVERVGATYRTNVEETLLAALAQAVGTQGGVLLSMESHGRETLDAFDPQSDTDLDLSRTVGWFTARYPLWLEAQADARLALIDAKARRRAVPRNGLHWGLLSTYGDAETKASLATLPLPLVSFNYLGQFDRHFNERGGFALADEAIGELTDRAATLAYPLDINARIVDGKLCVSWRYAPQVLPEQEAQALKARFERSLERLIDHAVNARAEATAADFVLAGLSQAQFESLKLDLARVEDIYPATPVQQGLLFHSALESGSGLYVNQRRLTLRGELDRAALRSAWTHAVASHAILRTQFETRHGGDALQVVLRNVDLPYVEHDWSSLDTQAYETRLHAWMREDVQRGFDVERAPLLRIALFIRADGAHDLIWTDHHVLLDGWSSAQLMREVADAYEALRAGREPVKNAPPYRDYVQWRLQQDEGEAWWREQAARVDEPATLLESLGLTDERKADRVVEEAAPLEHQLDETLSEALRDTARRHRVTLNTVLQGAWALLLSRYGNRGQAAFGVTVSGRPAHLPEVERMLGLFINSLPVWVDVPQETPLSNWLEALQQHNGALRQYEHTPLSRVQQWTARSGDALFDTLLVFENYPVDAALKGTGLTLEGIESAGRAHYPLTLVVLPDRETTLIWKYDAARLDAARVARIHAHFTQLLRLMVAQRDPLLRTLTLDVPQPATGDARRAEGAMLPHIAEHARRRGDLPAIVCEGQSLSWSALWQRAGELATRLHAAGLVADDIVAVALPRSLDLAVALVGVWRAGGVYLPLDIAAPAERLRAQLADSGARHLIAAALPAGQSALSDTLTCIDPTTTAANTNPATSYDFAADHAVPHPAQPAYVIYTSGSTGEPKGVVVGHGAMTAYVGAILERLPAGIGSAAYVSTPAADLGHTTLLGALWSGWTLHMIDDARATDPEAFSHYMAAQRIDALKIVPSHLGALLRGASTPADVLPRRCLVLGGEVAEAGLVAQIRSLASGCVLFNHYGPTETTVGVLAYEAHEADQALEAHHTQQARETRMRLPLGTPLAHASAGIVDRAGEPMPDGCAGELLIGGPALALGYLGRPAQTAERFVPDPNGPAGARAYRSGDRVRRQADGAFVFAGRIDDQVKIRGFRVEPAEVRAHLLAHPWIADAAVVAQRVAVAAANKDGSADTTDSADIANATDTTDLRLAAYAVLHADAPDTPWPVLREWLASRVSAHLVPSAFACLDALPLTRNGKLDRNALPPITPVADSAPLAPRTSMETLVFEVWREVLNLDAFGVQADFLELGGHSLLAVRIATRLTARLSRKVALADVLRHRTVERLAAALDDAQAAQAVAVGASAEQAGSARVDALNDLFETLD
ncbi:amino acid adenylation domain-containing protein [Paraburkholderia bryophila]|uniref:amino acid adenylation domain-containing protein n=1 Tax=Paraburkholderia bryophila TaxID=420952 RepID=UPI0038BB9E42